MKKTAFRVSQQDAINLLALNGLMSAENIGAELWPDKIGYGPSRGGPSSVAVSASRMMGKLRKRGLVDQKRWPDSRWFLTKNGERTIAQGESK